MIIDASDRRASDTAAVPIAVISRPLGRQTNNFAEYMAVVLGLERARSLEAEEVELILDSKLVVEQLSGRWRVKEPTLALLHSRATQLLSTFRRWSIRHEPRATNHAADALANLALDDPAAAAAAEAAGRGEAPMLAERAQPTPTPPVAPTAAWAAEDPIGRATVGAACAIFDGDGRVLLVHQTYAGRKWALPGGHSLPGEAPDAAARRELEEETGLRMSDGELAGVYYEAAHPRLGPVVHFVFRFGWHPDLAPAPQPPEIDEVAFWPTGALPGPMSDFTQRRIADAVEGGVTFGVVAPRRTTD